MTTFRRPSSLPISLDSFRPLWPVIVLAFVAGATPAFAVLYTWNGAGAENDWSTSANWSGGTAAVSATATTLAFSGSTRLASNANAAFSLTGLSFSSGAGAFTLSGSALSLTGGGSITNSSSNLQTIANSSLVLAGTTTFNAGASNAGLSVSSVLSGTGSLTKTGAGVLTLSSANSYSGTTTLTTGTLAVGDNAALGTSVLTFNGGALQATAERTLANTMTIAAASTISGASNLTFTGTLTGTASVALNVTNTGTTTFGAVNLSSTNTARTLTLNVTGGTTFITGTVADGGTGAGGLTKSGTGLLVLSGTNTYAGTTTVSGGTLRLDSTAALPVGGAVIVGSAVANQNATLDLNGNSFSIGTLQFGGVTARSGVVNSVSTGAGTLTLGGNVSYVNSGTAAISGKLNLGGATRTFTVADSANVAAELTINADISGTGGIIKAGAGTLELTSANNTYSGATTITAGALRLSSFGTFPSTTNFVLNGGVLELAADVALVSGSSAGQLTLLAGGFSTSGGNRTVNYNDGAAVTWGSGDFVLDGSAFTLSSTSSNGTVTFSNNIDLGGAVRTVTVADGTTAVDAVLGGMLSNGGLTLSGTGTLQLGGANTYAGATTLLNGTLSIADLADGGTASSLGASSNAGSNLVLGGGVLRYTGAATTTDRLIQIGTGTSANGTTGYLDSSGSGAVVFSNTGAVTYGLTNRTRTLSLQGTNTGDNTFAASIGNNGTSAVRVDKEGTGKWVLSGANTYTDITYIYEGTLSVANDSALGATTTGVAMIDGATLNLNNVNVGAEPLSLVGKGVESKGALTSTGTSSYAGRITFGTDDAYIGVSGSLTLTGDLREIYSGTLATKVGDGTLIIGGTGFVDSLDFVVNEGTLFLNKTTSSAITGSVTVNNGGTLRLGGTNGDQIYGYSPATVNSGGLFDLNGRSETMLSLGGSGLVTNDVASTASRLTVGISDWGTTATFSGIMQDGAGTLAFTKTGIGIQILSGANTYSGTTTISGGTLQVGAGGTTGQLGSGAVTNNATLVFNRSDASTVNNVISGTGTVTQAGGGVLSLTGINTYSGATLVTAGTLKLSGTLTQSAVTVGSGATLTGNGVIANTLTVQSGGTVSPGSSPGLLTIGSGSSLLGTTLMELGGLSRGITYDAIDVTGAGAVTFGGTLFVSLIDGFTPTAGDQFDLLNYISATNTFTSFNLPTLDVGLNWDTTQLYSTGVISVTSAIPEPSAFAALFGASALAFVVLRRRRKRV